MKELIRIATTFVQKTPEGKYQARIKFDCADGSTFDARRLVPESVLVGARTSHRARAEAWAHDLAMDLLDESKVQFSQANQGESIETLPSRPGVKPSGVTFDQFMAKEFAQVRSAKITSRTLRHELRDYRQWIQPKHGSRPLSAFTKADYLALHAELKAGQKGQYVRRVLLTLRTIIKAAGVLDHCPPVVWPDVTTAKEPVNGAVLSQGQYAAIIDEPKRRNGFDPRVNHRLICLLGGEAGLRSAEIAGLMWECVNFERREIRVCRQVGDKNELTETKGRSERIVPITLRLLEELKREKIRHQSAFVLGRKFSHDTASKIVSLKMRRLKRKDLSLMARSGAHALRHYFGTTLLDRGLPIHQISELLGHKSIETTQVYLHVDQSRAASDAAALLDAMPEVKSAEVISLDSRRARS